MAELTMFAYPWDLADRELKAVVGELAELGVDRLALAVTYHSAQTIAPRRHHAVYTEIEANVAHIPLPDGAFTDLRPQAGRLAVERPELLARLAAAADAAGIRITAWTIALHNSRLATARPDTALRNCFNDPSTHGLCPSNPTVRRYVLELSAAVRGLACFDEVLLESIAYLLAAHGHPHELSGVTMDPPARLLLSLCFCRHCLAEGARLGIDGGRLSDWVSAELRRTWNSPLALARRPDDGTELAGLLVARPDLHAWIHMRQTMVTSLVEAAVAEAATTGTAIATTGAVWVKPSSLGWMEGVDLGALAGACHRVTLMPYYTDLADVARDIDQALASTPPEKIQLVQTLWPRHHGSAAGLLAKVECALATGIDQIGLYNFALAPEPTLAWIPQVARLVHRDRPT